MTSVWTSERFEPGVRCGCAGRPANRARRPRGSKAFHGGIGHLHFNVVLHARRPRDHHAGDGARPIPFQALPFHRQWNGRHRLAAHHVRYPASLEVLIRRACGTCHARAGLLHGPHRCRPSTSGAWEGHYILDFIEENKSDVRPDYHPRRHRAKFLKLTGLVVDSVHPDPKSKSFATRCIFFASRTRP